MSKLPEAYAKFIFQQGFTCPLEQLNALHSSLRVTPLVCAALTATGLMLQSPALLLLVGLMGVVAFWFPAGHPVDWLFNRFFAHRLHMAKVPPNPLPRRLACLAGGGMNWLAAGLLLHGHTAWAISIGFVLLGLQMVVTFTHFCALSWLIEKLNPTRAATFPIGVEQARKLVSQGALLVDVRHAEEAARFPISGAINIPSAELQYHLEDLRHVTSILFCASGRRSAAAVLELRRCGIIHAYDLGPVKKAQDVSRHEMSPRVLFES